MFSPCCSWTRLSCLQGEGGWQEGEPGPGVVLGGGGEGAVARLGAHRQAAPGLPSPVPHHRRGGPHDLQRHGIEPGRCYTISRYCGDVFGGECSSSYWGDGCSLLLGIDTRFIYDGNKDQ